MIRKLAIAAVLSGTSLVTAIPAASAQTGITLSFGTGGYGYGDDDGQRYDPYQGYYYQQQPSYGYYNYNSYQDPRYQDPRYQDRRWQERQRREQLERWREERAREYYRQRQSWGDRDDDDD